jgi:hypothetical protein
VLASLICLLRFWEMVIDRWREGRWGDEALPSDAALSIKGLI